MEREIIDNDDRDRDDLLDEIMIRRPCTPSSMIVSRVVKDFGLSFNAHVVAAHASLLTRVQLRFGVNLYLDTCSTARSVTEETVLFLNALMPLRI
jgi:hypothetical protein